jgi:hypothetical protein
VNNRYLAVWQDGRNITPSNKGTDIFGQLIQTDGGLVGSNFPISTAPRMQDRVKVAYNSVAQYFLVVWSDFRDLTISGGDIFGQIVDPEGTLIGANFPISTAPGDQFRPNLAYDPDHNRFLIAWIDCRNAVGVIDCQQGEREGTDIYGQVVAGDGTLVGPDFAIGIGEWPQYRPNVVYSPVDKLFQVVWVDERNNEVGASGIDVFRQVITPDGTFLGGNTPVTFALKTQTRPVQAYNSIEDTILVVYGSLTNDPSDIVGQFMSLSRLVGPEITISTEIGDQTSPTTAYSSVDERFLSVWTDTRNQSVTGKDIFMQSIEATGTLVGSNLPLATAINDQQTPVLGYSVDQNHFLATWSERRGTAVFANSIAGQKVDAIENLIGTSFTISTGERSLGGSAVAYVVGADHLLVVWTDYRNRSISGANIWGQLVQANGTLVGANFPITDALTDQFKPAVAYSEGSQQFLVVWVDCRDNVSTCSQSMQSGTTIFGQLVDINGNLVGESFPITTVSGKYAQPAVAYNMVDEQFLIVWEDNRDTATFQADIYGQRMSGAGTFLGGNFPISIASGHQRQPVIKYSPIDNQFLVVWIDEQSGSGRVMGQAISGGGLLLGDPFPLSNEQQNQRSPAIAYDAINNQFLVIWEDSRNASTAGTDIFGQLVILIP